MMLKLMFTDLAFWVHNVETHLSVDSEKWLLTCSFASVSHGLTGIRKAMGRGLTPGILQDNGRYTLS